MPYFIIQRYTTLSLFLLLIRPVLQFALCFAAYNIFSLAKPAASGKGTAKSIIAIPLFLIMFFVPTFIETAWFLGADAQIWVTLSIVYLFLSFVAFPILARSASKASEISEPSEM